MISTAGVDRPTSDAPTVREQLIEGTIALIDHEGLRDLSVRRLAAASERTTMCVYTKFGNRAALLETVYDELAAGLLTGLRASADPASVLREFARAHPERYAFLVSTDPALLDLDAAPQRALVAGLVEVLGAETFALVHGGIVLARAGTARVDARVDAAAEPGRSEPGRS